MKVRKRVLAWLLALALVIPIAGNSACMTVFAEEIIESEEQIDLTEETVSEEVSAEEETTTEVTETEEENMFLLSEEYVEDDETGVTEKVNEDAAEMITEEETSKEEDSDESTEELYLEEGPEINAADSTKFYASDAIVPGCLLYNKNVESCRPKM